MITLKDLIVSVKEKNLSKDQLEGYRDELSGLYADMQMELAEVEKEKALFFEEKGKPFLPSGLSTGYLPIPSDISIKRHWQADKRGLREITLKRYCLATKELLNSLKSRLYQVY